VQDEEEGSLLLVMTTLTRPEVSSSGAESELKEEVYTHLDEEKERDARVGCMP
jgi:hypothetical protein